MASKGQSSVGQDQDDIVFMPYTTVMKKMRAAPIIQQITVSAASADDVGRDRRSVTSLLRVRHKIQPGDPDDFLVRTIEEMAAHARAGDADHDGAARQHRRLCRCSSAASAS